MKRMVYIMIILAASSACGETSKKLIPVKPQQLYNRIAESDSMVIKGSPMDDAKVLFRSDSLKDLKSFSDCLVLNKPNPEEYFHCMCIGAPAIYFYKNGEETVHLTNHHGRSIRCSLWSSDVEIPNVDKWVRWFDNHGISSVREEVEYTRTQAEKSKKDWEKWSKAMPKSIKFIWKDVVGNFGTVDTIPLIKALENEMPDKIQRILVLLEWYGSGAGPWSGFPSYEDAAKKMLLKYTTKEIVIAIQSTELSTAQIEGGARLFGGWTFNKQRPDGLNELSQEMKKMFWNHVKSTEDNDKLRRAKRAFKK